MVPVIMISLFTLFISSTAIFVCLGLSGFISIIFASTLDPIIVVQRIIAGINTFALMALPFFILAANLMDSGGMSRRLLRLARALIGHVSGGIAMATELASMFFGALSGSSPATIVAIGKIMLPDLQRQGYPKSFIGGLLATSGSVALIIPPSITLIIFGAVTGASVGKLFVGGITAGLLFGGSSLLYIYFYAKKHKLRADKRPKRIYSILYDAFMAGLAMIGPGVKMPDVFHAVQNKVNAKIPGFKRGHYGHSIGCNRFTEEYPFIAAGNDDVFRENMVFCLEVPFYGSKNHSYNVEDTFMVTKDGIELFTHCNPTMFI